ncbi:hypothetical protein CB1_001512004 [Camelus ferus]|nr:hypothetical protein CB1_001512004 [Camelus ferus]
MCRASCSISKTSSDTALFLPSDGGGAGEQQSDEKPPRGDVSYQGGDIKAKPTEVARDPTDSMLGTVHRASRGSSVCRGCGSQEPLHLMGKIKHIPKPLPWEKKLGGEHRLSALSSLRPPDPAGPAPSPPCPSCSDPGRPPGPPAEVQLTLLTFPEHVLSSLSSLASKHPESDRLGMKAG